MSDFNNTIDLDENDGYEIAIERMCLPGFLPVRSMDQVYGTQYPPREPIIDGLIYPGTYLLSGSPKTGKSFLALQWCYHVSKGLPIWERNVDKGTTLYLALEDDYQRLQFRSYRMFGAETSSDLYFAISAKKIGAGLEEQLSTFVLEHPGTKMIIIDTLQKIRSEDKNCGYKEDYAAVGAIKKIADKLGIAIVLVHHTRKQEAADSFDMISGTKGLLGAADGGMVLYKQNRTDMEAIMEITGRDGIDQKIHLLKNPDTLAWELKSVDVEERVELPNPILELVERFLSSDTLVWAGSATELVELLNLDMKANTLSAHLNVNTGRLYKEYGIVYERSRSGSCRTITLTRINK